MHESRRIKVAFVWDIIMVALAIGSIGLVVWFEAADLSPASRQTVLRLDLAIVGIFLGDWLVGLVRATDRRAYVKSTWWELLGMIPLYVSAAGLWRFLRLLRVLRVLRAIRRVGKLVDRSQQIAKESNILSLALASTTITLVGATLVWLVEQDAPGSGMRTFSEAVWWAVVTVTTVGYGDVTPITTVGRGVAVVLMVTGIGTIGLFASQVSSTLVSREQRERRRSRRKGPASQVEESSTAPGDLATQLAQVASLHDEGKLTDEEFTQAKAKLLSP